MKNLSPVAYARLDEIIRKYENMKTPIMMILKDFQHEFGYIPLDVQEIIAKRLDIPVAEIYGIITFYSFFSLEPKGKYVIGVCMGTACYVKGGQLLVDRLQEVLGIKAGQTTEDGLFTIDILRCFGACALAPAMMINGKVMPYVKPGEVQRLIDECVESSQHEEAKA